MSERSDRTNPSGVMILALVCALIAACERDQSIQSERPEEAVASGPVSPAETPPELTPEELRALAFRAAWGAPPPIERREVVGGQEDVRTYRSGQLVPLGAGRFAFLSSGEGGDAHVNAGSLAIHYLSRNASGFRLEGSWPGFIVSGTFGQSPRWTVRHDIMPSPSLVVEGGGTWQGYSCGWADIVELTPSGPIVRAPNLRLSYGSGGALGDAGESFDGVIEPGVVGHTFLVRFSGDHEGTVTFAKAGDEYDPVDMPDMPWC